VLKYIQVYKFLFWNLIIGAVDITLGSEYAPRFFISLATLAVILFASLFNMALGMVYFINYACFRRVTLLFAVGKALPSVI
jgi:hypothetical protein